MTAPQKLIQLILTRAEQYATIDSKTLEIDWSSPEKFEEYFWDDDDENGFIQDAKEDVRSGSVETNIAQEYSRHYESKSVASQAVDGSWIGWTYWYGGGKHGDPGSIDWIDEAYDLECEEEEKLVIVREFKKNK